MRIIMRRIIPFRRRRRVKFPIRTKRNPNKIGSRFGKIQNDYPLKIRTALGGISTSEVRRRRQDCASLGRAAVRRVGRRRTADIARRCRNVRCKFLWNVPPPLRNRRGRGIRYVRQTVIRCKL